MPLLQLASLTVLYVFIQNSISELSGKYASRLECVKYTRNGWVRAGSVLLQRSRDLSTLRVNAQHPRFFKSLTIRVRII